MAAFTESYSVMPGGVPRNFRQRGTGSDFDVQGAGAEALLNAISLGGTAPDAAPGGGFMDRVGSRMRMAADKPLETIGLAKGGKLRMGRVAGLGSLLALISAAGELSNPEGTAGGNLARAGGVAVGGIGGGAGGAALGGILTGGNPLGILVGSAIGNALGSAGGRGLSDAVVGMAEGSPEERAIRNAQKQARAAAESEAERARILMPIQNEAASIALENERKRQEMLAGLSSQQMLQQAMAQGLLAQQQAGAQQQIALSNAILGGA